MDKEPSLFERFMFEAPGDDPPDTPAETSTPPDMPADAGSDDGPPPDIPDDPSGNDGPPDDDPPPDMGGDDDSFSGDDGFEDATGEDETEGDNDKDLGLDDKVSAIMNMNLYQRYQTLLTRIASQLTMVKNNMDILYTLSPESIDIVKSLKKLDENIRLYLKNSFLHENYSKNLLFFNKCLNLLKLLNDSFDSNIQKGIKDMK